jgi:hypothetical protein
METLSLKERLTDAIRYWEPRRVLYNVVLAAIVGFYFFAGYPASRQSLTVDEILLVFLMAVLANVAYCAAYLPDVVAQSSGLLETWRRYRWIVLVIGLLFAGIITRFIAMGMFASPK